MDAYKIDFDSESDILLIAFAGFGDVACPEPAFEFFKTANKFKCKKLFLRDLDQCWYHKGIRELGENIDESIAAVKKLILEANVKQIIVTGNSMGGYAAILFGNLINADVVLAFSPQTFISQELRFEYQDYRAKHTINFIYENYVIKREYVDLKWLLSTRPTKTKFFIFYAEDYLMDTIHAKRMDCFSYVELRSYEQGGHALVQAIRNSGELESIFSEYIPKII